MHLACPFFALQVIRCTHTTPGLQQLARTEGSGDQRNRQSAPGTELPTRIGRPGNGPSGPTMASVPSSSPMPDPTNPSGLPLRSSPDVPARNDVSAAAGAFDGLLIGRVREKDQTAMGEIFDRYATMVYSVA